MMGGDPMDQNGRWSREVVDISRARITKHAYFSYEVSGNVDSFTVDVLLYNKYFAELLSIEPQGEMNTDRSGNVSATYRRPFITPLHLVYECALRERPELPSQVFVNSAMIDNVFRGNNIAYPWKDKARDIAARFRSNGGSIKNLKNIVRERCPELMNTSNPCENYARMSALAADILGYKAARVSGFTSNASDLGAFGTVTITDKSGVHRFRSDTGHAWALVTDWRSWEVCDASIIPNGEKRFVEHLNAASSVSMCLSMSALGQRPSGSIHNGHVYTAVDFED